jgi:transcriptional regulator with XRE-family HTH domain
MNIFGQKLKKLREDKGLTQQQLAEKLGYVTNSYLSDAEKGAFIPSEEKLKKIAKVLHTPYSKLKELLIESKLESMGITEQAFISIFKDYSRLTKKDKQVIINAYLKIKARNEKKE